MHMHMLAALRGCRPPSAAPPRSLCRPVPLCRVPVMRVAVTGTADGEMRRRDAHTRGRPPCGWGVGADARGRRQVNAPASTQHGRIIFLNVICGACRPSGASIPEYFCACVLGIYA
eukprot:6404267-Prymnesium_polylepis.2